MQKGHFVRLCCSSVLPRASKNISVGRVAREIDYIEATIYTALTYMLASSSLEGVEWHRKTQKDWVLHFHCPSQILEFCANSAFFMSANVFVIAICNCLTFSWF